MNNLFIKTKPPTKTKISGNSLLLVLILLFFFLLTSTKVLADTFTYPTQVDQYGKFETGLNIQSTFDNPFDQNDVKVLVHFLAPSTKETIIPAFWYQNYNQCNWNNMYMTPVGNPYFMVRFTPTEVGQYSWRAVVTDRNGTRQTSQNTFQSNVSSNKGFIGISTQNPRYFSYLKDGSTFFPIGENLGWANFPSDILQNPTQTTFEQYFSKLSQNKANYVRIWAGATFTHFNMENKTVGLGKFDLARAWCLDQVINYAEQYNIKLMLSLDYHGELSTITNSNWDRNPYNLANGGPCSTPVCFWTDPTARNFYKKKLEYITSRYARSPNLFLWEFWNEVDITEAFNDYTVKNWHQEMGSYLQSLDPYKHIITTSFAGDGPDSLYSLNENQVVQNHTYTPITDYAQAFNILGKQKYNRYPDKPFMIGEYGADGKDSVTDNLDTEGVHFHNGIWSPMFSWSSGTAMIWYWDNYIDPKNLYYHYRPFADFITDINLSSHNYKPSDVDIYLANPKMRVKKLKLTGPMTYWQDQQGNRPITVNIDSDGKITNAQFLNRILNNQLHNNPNIYNPTTFNVSYLQAGDFSVVVDAPYYGGNLVISLDGVKKLDKVLPTSGLTLPDTNTIQIPAGNHQIEVKNTKGGYFGAQYIFSLTTSKPPLEGYALIDTSVNKPNDIVAVLWIKHENYNWFDIAKAGITPTTVVDAKSKIAGLTDGTYKIQWWNSQNGGIISEVNAVSTNGFLETTIPPVQKDIAAKIYFISSSLTHCTPLGDLDCSGKVNILDLSAFLSAFGSITNKQADLDNSGKVNMIDLSILLQNFGK